MPLKGWRTGWPGFPPGWLSGQGLPLTLLGNSQLYFTTCDSSLPAMQRVLLCMSSPWMRPVRVLEDANYRSPPSYTPAHILVDAQVLLFNSPHPVLLSKTSNLPNLMSPPCRMNVWTAFIWPHRLHRPSLKVFRSPLENVTISLPQLIFWSTWSFFFFLMAA